eukprot:gene13533-14309_t
MASPQEMYDTMAAAGAAKIAAPWCRQASQGSWLVRASGSARCPPTRRTSPPACSMYGGPYPMLPNLVVGAVATHCGGMYECWADLDSFLPEWVTCGIDCDIAHGPPARVIVDEGGLAEDALRLDQLQFDNLASASLLIFK